VLHRDNLGDKLDVTLTVSSPKTHAQEPGDYGMKPGHGTFLVVTVTGQVAAGGEGSYHLNPFNFGFVGSDGTVYDIAFASFPNNLDAVDMAAGQKRSSTCRRRVKMTPCRRPG